MGPHMLELSILRQRRGHFLGLVDILGISEASRTAIWGIYAVEG
jgi:hypothetical protein